MTWLQLIVVGHGDAFRFENFEVSWRPTWFLGLSVSRNNHCPRTECCGVSWCDVT